MIKTSNASGIVSDICAFLREFDHYGVIDFECDFCTSLESHVADCLITDPAPIIGMLLEYADDDVSDALDLLDRIDSEKSANHHDSCGKIA